MMDGRFDQHFLEVFASGERGPGTAPVLILVLVAVAVAAALILLPGSVQPLA